MIPVQPPNLSSPLSPGAVSPLRLLTEGDRALLDATILPAKLPNLVLGEQVSARIAEQLGDNQVAVLIKNALFTLTLPPGVQAKGDTLNLRVASLKPNLSFALQDSEASSEQKDSSVQVALSPASRYLTRLLSAASQDDAGGAGGQAAGGTAEAEQARQATKGGGDATQAALKGYVANARTDNPLLKQAGQAQGEAVALDVREHATEQVAGNLKQGVANSGLFYEAHLKAWDQGKLPLTQLQQEPQAKLGEALAQADSGGRNSALPELGNLVQRQLNTLENQQVPLQGFAWPGQPMQMLLQAEPGTEREGNGESEMQAWSSQLSLSLPVLGGVSARVRLVGRAVQVSFVTEEGAAGSLIQRHGDKLVAGMAAAGLDLATLTVKHEETPTQS